MCLSVATTCICIHVYYCVDYVSFLFSVYVRTISFFTVSSCCSCEKYTDDDDDDDKVDSHNSL